MSNRTRLIVTVIIFLVISSQLALFGYIFHMIDRVKIIDADIYLTEKTVGFNLDKDRLHFGSVPRGQVSSYRHITVTNSADYGLDVILAGRGDLGKWVHFELPDGTSTNSFYLGAGEEMDLRVYAYPPSDAQRGKYEGQLIIIFKKHKFFN